MDGEWLIEQNRKALKRVVLGLAAMVDGPTLPRRFRNFVLRLLRPAEAAARRLVIALARGVAVLPPGLRLRNKTLPAAILRNGVGTGVLWPPGAGSPAAPPGRLALPLVDPLPRAGHARSSSVPSISVPGCTGRIAMPQPTSPRDEISAARLVLRFGALSAALDDLPAQALRFARWRARRGAGQALAARRRWPLRMGRAPGGRSKHEVFDILHSAHQLAFFALEYPDTS